MTDGSNDMPLPSAVEARGFYRAAWQRWDDARFLAKQSRYTGAVYLAGYGVECMLKALILAHSPKNLRQETLASFRGAKAHDFFWLRLLYNQRGGPAFSRPIIVAFERVNTWTTDLRYKPGQIKGVEAAAFLDEAERIVTWADGRF